MAKTRWKKWDTQVFAVISPKTDQFSAFFHRHNGTFFKNATQQRNDKAPHHNYNVSLHYHVKYGINVRILAHALKALFWQKIDILNIKCDDGSN